ncbi:MAG: hypothetical protein JWR70_2358 [Modestobacter sp.]|jgi:hypothetical protein|nr:hypothetical protein [Modestobacter sp.]
MTTTPADPGPTDLEGEGRAVPPYEGRRESADVEGEERLRRDGANVGGATGPVRSEERKAPEPADTPGGAVASPADEQPAADTPGDEPGEASVGPAHHPGTTRGEDVSRDQHDRGSGGTGGGG